MPEKILSLLVLTVPRRVSTCFPPLILDLYQQAAGSGQVEVLALFDNRTRTIGAKRQSLLEMAQGRYFAFIDDDDRVSPDFVSSTLETIGANPGVDLVLYQTVVERPGMPNYVCYYSKEIEKPVFDAEPHQIYYGPPAHHHVWRTELGRQCRFPDMNAGEDFAWTLPMRKLVQTEVQIPKVLYWYNYNLATSESAKVD